MPVDQELAQSYIQDTLKKMEAAPTSLTEEERRMCRKYFKNRSIAAQLQQEIQTLRNQIEQAEANIRSKELQIADCNGKSSMAMEMMVSMKFEDEAEADSEFQAAVARAKEESKKKPPAPANRKQRRATKARSKKNQKANQPEQGA